MALQKQPVSINLSAGLDTKTDSKHVVPGMLTLLENGVYRKGMAIEKRRGHDRLKNNDIDDTELGIGSALENFNDELLQFNNQKLYGYSANADKWIEKGDAINIAIKSNQIVKNTATQTTCDSAILNGVGVYAYEDSRGGVRASVVDEATGTVLLADVLLNAGGEKVRCIAFSGYIYVFYLDVAANLVARRLNPQSPGSFEAQQGLSDSLDTSNPLYDVIVFQGKLLVIHNGQTSNTAISFWLDEDLVEPVGSYAAKEYATSFDNCVTLVPAGSTVYVLYYNSSDSETQFFRLNQLGELVGSLDVLMNTDEANRITGIVNDDGDGVTVFYEELSASGARFTQVFKQEISVATPAAKSVLLNSVGLWTRAFEYTDANSIRGVFVGVTHESTLQSTYFLIRSDALIVGKQQYTNGGGLTTSPILQNVNANGAVFSYALLKKNRIVSENAVIFTPTGVTRTQVDFSESERFIAKQLGNNLLICGGVLNMYDGQSIVEHGFLLYPEDITVQTFTTGGTLPAGSYQVTVVYEWTDNFGQIHRSRPSVPETISTTGSTSTIVVSVPALNITRKNGISRSDVSIVGYVTEVNGTIPYRFTSISTPVRNIVTGFNIGLPTITAPVSPSNEILYTTGGVLANDVPPSCQSIEIFQNRAWLGGLEDENGIWFSKENKINAPVEFSDEFKKAISSSGGPVSALSFVDDKLLVFKADRFFITYGDGPNDTNTLGGFSELEDVSVDVGCSNPRSITQLPNGIIVKTSKGFYSIDSGLNAQYVGAQVEEYNGQSVTSAKLIPDLNEVRFTTSDGLLLTYNYYFGKWNTAPNLKSSSSVLWRNRHVLLKTDGAIFAQNQDIYKDASAGYGMVLESGWISLGSLSSFKRVYELLFMGTYHSQHKVRVKLAYDNDPAWIHSGVYDPTSEFPVEIYGDDSPYGESGTVYGGAPIDYAIRVRLKRQKCSSIKFRFEELTADATSGSHQALTISDVGLLVGMKKGSVKKAQQRNMRVN